MGRIAFSWGGLPGIGGGELVLPVLGDAHVFDTLDALEEGVREVAGDDTGGALVDFLDFAASRDQVGMEVAELDGDFMGEESAFHDE
jgi:hypothetical protein